MLISKKLKYDRMTYRPLFSIVNNHLGDYPTPVNINYLWGMGLLSGICLGIQIVSGLLLVPYYSNESANAFISVDLIMRDVHYGWLMRYVHANGASMFFICVYIHIFRGIYYGSFKTPREALWLSGMLIYVVMMMTAFFGYVLPWGQMSFWGATVITSMVSAIPQIGQFIVEWIWGGKAVGEPLLRKAFMLHFVLPFAILGLVMIHISILHQTGSSEPLGTDGYYYIIPFYPYYYIKDLFGFIIFLFVFSSLVIYSPNFLGEPDNYIKANPMVTPEHIVPEWYFLAFYAILRSIPNKLMGVICMALSMFILALLPFIYMSNLRGCKFQPLYKQCVWSFAGICYVLTCMGKRPPEYPYNLVGLFSTIYYFFCLTVMLPITDVAGNLLYQVYVEAQVN